MDAVAEGLWGLADYHESKGEVSKTVKCLEAICQSQVSFLPIVEVKTRLRIASLLLKHSHNVNHAKSHLERAMLLLKSIPSCHDLKCRNYSLLSQCYHLVGSIPQQKQILLKAFELTSSSPQDATMTLWACNFNSQLANALILEGDCQSAIEALESGYLCATQLAYPEMQMFFATSILHANLIQWCDESLVLNSLYRCDELWGSLRPETRENCLGLLLYHELLHVLYYIRVCDYKNATQHVEKLDTAMKGDVQKVKEIERILEEVNALNRSLAREDLPYKERSVLSAKHAQIQEQLSSMNRWSFSGEKSVELSYFGNSRREWKDKLILAPPPLDGEWLPKGAVYALVDLMMVIFGRPRGLFKDCTRRIQSGMQTVHSELGKLGITDNTKEGDLQPSLIWMAGIYLILLMQFLENKVAVELTRSEFVDAQKALVQMKNWFVRFPTLLQSSESVIEILRGQYAHSVCCYREAAFHYIEAAKLTETKSVQVICQVYAAISFFCLSDAESSAQALDLIGPIYRVKEGVVGIREQASVLYTYGLLLMRQEDFEEARTRLAKGLQIAHSCMGNLQLIAQYLTILGHLALSLHDTSQAREILRSSLTLAKKLNDLPTQLWVLSILTTLYQRLGETDNLLENEAFRNNKSQLLQQRLAEASSSVHHLDLIKKSRIEVTTVNEVEMKRALEIHSNLDIPESVGLSSPNVVSSSRFFDLDTSKRGKKKA